MVNSFILHEKKASKLLNLELFLAQKMLERLDFFTAPKKVLDYSVSSLLNLESVDKLKNADRFVYRQKKSVFVGSEEDIFTGDFLNPCFNEGEFDCILSHLLAVPGVDFKKAASCVSIMLNNSQPWFFSGFINGSLHQLRSSWEKLDGYEHIVDFPDVTDFTAILSDLGFKDIVIDVTTINCSYYDIKSLLQDLKLLGYGVYLKNRKKGLSTKTLFKDLEKNYPYYLQNGSRVYNVGLEYIVGVCFSSQKKVLEEKEYEIPVQSIKGPTGNK